MLVLKRKEGEKIILRVGGVEIVVEVTEFPTWGEARSVRLGITAPPEVRIAREEIAHLMFKEQS